MFIYLNFLNSNESFLYTNKIYNTPFDQNDAKNK